MGEEKSSTVKLFGMWASPYVLRAKLGLKLKGIEYENIEEDLSNKSELLMIQYNPMHNKVPVLVHNGLPIVDSSIILEYIDETWTQPPHLLPKDPYLRAKHRFWAAYLQQVAEKKRKLLSPTIEAKESEEIIDEYKNNMDVAEQLIKEILPNNQVPCFQDGSSVKPGYLDIILYSLLGNSDLADELFGCKPFTEERYPFLSSWVNALSQVPEFKELTPPKSKLNEVIRAVRNNKVPRSQQRLNIYKAAFATFKSFNSQPNNV